MPDKHLAIYLQDHLAGATAGVELVRRTAGSNEGTEIGRELRDLCAEIEADRATLRQLMTRLGVGEDRPKMALAWVGEKVGRLKLNGQLRGYSPLSRLVELEALRGGIVGKEMLWRALDRHLGAAAPGFDFAALAERARSQGERVETMRLAAAAAVFGAHRPG